MAPHDTYRRNATDRDIRKPKNDFDSGISGNDKLFTINLWYIPLDQAQTMLNMLRYSIHNTNISSHAIM